MGFKLTGHTLRWRGKLSSAHFVEGHPKCGVMHGHTYNVEVELFGATDKFTDMLMDFGDIKRVVKGYDHRVLNDIMDCEKATVEKLATYIFLEIADIAPGGVQSIRVTVDEGGAGEVVAYAARTS